jgi:hypothetical protein
MADISIYVKIPLQYLKNPKDLKVAESPFLISTSYKNR